MSCTALEMRCDAENDIQMQVGAAADDFNPAPCPTTTETVPHPLLDGLDQRKPPLATADEYVIDNLLGLRQTGDSCSAKVRWFDYASKDDTWKPLENLPRNLVVCFFRQKKEHVSGFEWQTSTRRSLRQAGLTTVANIVMKSTSILNIQHVHVTGDEIIHDNVSWTD